MKNSILVVSLVFTLFATGQGRCQGQPAPEQALLVRDPLVIQTLNENIQIENLNDLDLHYALKLPPQFHAYFDAFKVEVTNPKDSVEVKTFVVKPLVDFFDKFSKQQRRGIKENGDLDITLHFKNDTFKNQKAIQIAFTYQACSEQFCLLPVHKTIEQIFEYSPQNTDKNHEGATMDSSNIIDLIQQKSALAFFLVFIAGILTSFTPCIFPMIPITLSILGSQTIGQTKLRGFLISLMYVFGIAATYSILGVVAAKTGTLFGSVLSSPIAVVAVAIVFVIMALSLFGFYEIQVPEKLRSKLHGKKTSQSFAGAFISGLIAGIVASPCVGPVLVALLAYVAKSQNIVLGFSLLFTYAFGMGLIFLVLGTFSQLLSKLPRSGPWMVKVKKIFGTILILMAAYYVYPLVKSYFVAPLTESKDFNKWQTYSEDKIKQNVGQSVVIIDFGADWCAACGELEKYTYSNLEVQSKLSHALLFKVDATQENATVTPILEKYGVIGLPTVLFIEKDGTIRNDLSLTGYEGPADFLKRLEKLNSL